MSPALGAQSDFDLVSPWVTCRNGRIDRSGRQRYLLREDEHRGSRMGDASHRRDDAGASDSPPLEVIPDRDADAAGR
jgi:hypothetical protein